MLNKLRIFALGGLDENGKNMYVIEINDDIFVLEAGIKYPESSMPGIDMIIPDVGYLIKNKKRVKGYFISHGHDDIMGALPYVLNDVPAPIYCSRITAELIMSSAKRYKLNVNFDFRLASPNSKSKIDKYDVYYFSTTHSVGESLGIAIDTGSGLVVYTGDFIIDYGALPQYRTDVNMLSQLGDKKVLVLLTESVDCDKTGHTSPNHKITPIVENIFSEHKGRILATFYTQNLFGIREIIDLAVKYQRKIVIYDDEMKQVLGAVSKFGILSIPPTLQLSKDELNRPGNEDAVIIISGIGEYLFRTLEQIAGGESEAGLKIKSTDMFIIGSPSIPGLEVISTRAIDELYKTGANILNIKKKQLSSMHAHEEDIKMMLSIFHPKYYMPVKGEYRHLIANAQIAVGMQQGYNHKNVFVCDNGMVVTFEDGVYKGLADSVPVGEVMIDGLGIGDVGSQAINDRQKLSDNGVLILGITVDTKKKEIIAGPDVQMRGLIFLKDADDFLKELTQLFQTLVLEALESGNIKFDETKVKIRDKINFFVRKATGKDPMVLPVIVEV